MVSYKPGQFASIFDLHERVAGLVAPSKVVAIALNTSAIASPDDARREIARIAAETGLPVDDPVRFGAGKLVDAVLAAAQHIRT